MTEWCFIQSLQDCGGCGWHLNPALRKGLITFIAFGDGLGFGIARRKNPSNYDSPSTEKNHKKRRPHVGGHLFHYEYSIS